MSLLPKSHERFGDTDYWDSFFRKRGKKAFEWYGDYNELCTVIHKHVKPTEKILVVGCGNSKLSADLYDVGFTGLTNIDTSDVVIKQMTSANADARPSMVFLKEDATNMTFEDNSFGCVLDKGTLDAIMTKDTDEIKATVNKMFKEIGRVLRVGGRYICISLLQYHILTHLVDWLSEQGWPIRIIRVKEVEESRSAQENVFPVFAIVATKFKKMPNMTQIYEMGSSTSVAPCRMSSKADLVSSVRGIQQFAAVRAGAAKRRPEADSGQEKHEDVCLELRDPSSDVIKYSLFIAERNKPSSLKFAVFIVPQGRESEWLFASRDGRLQLAESASCQRLVVVHLQRAYTYQTLQDVQNELSPFVMELSPSGLSSGEQVPFLSVGQDTLGERIERCRGRSNFSGEFVVEDVKVNQDYFRRLIFCSNPNLTQSEAKLKQVKQGKSSRRVLDESYLACAHHSLMIGAVGAFARDAAARCLVVGLGGGALPAFITNTFQNVSVDVAEIDSAMLKVATEQFGFKESSRLRVNICDGLDYINTVKGEKYDVVMFDVDSKDSSVGMSCPPVAFVQKDFLARLKQGCLVPSGLFILNLVCRDSKMREAVIGDLRCIFASVLSYKVPEEVNEVVYCTDDPRWSEKQGSRNSKGALNAHPLVDSFKITNDQLRLGSDRRKEDDFVDISQSLKLLHIL